MTGTPGSPRVGDLFPLDPNQVGDCPGAHSGPGGWPALCVLDSGHDGPHVATDGEQIVEVWGGRR